MVESFGISEFIVYPWLYKAQRRRVAGDICNRWVGSSGHLFSNIVRSEDVPMMKVPRRAVIKYTEKKYVDLFFENGCLRLGSFSGYSKSNHEMIGDSAEGSFVIVGLGSNFTNFSVMYSGFNNYIFCCSLDDAIPGSISSDYDDGYRINDVVRFSDAVGDSLKAVSKTFSSCVYSRDKVIEGPIPDKFQTKIIGSNLLSICREERYFVKHSRYIMQSEFRFAWQLRSEVRDSLVLYCPEAVKYCCRL